jgi:histidinol phosphatase-like enzyme
VFKDQFGEHFCASRAGRPLSVVLHVEVDFVIYDCANPKAKKLQKSVGTIVVAVPKRKPKGGIMEEFHKRFICSRSRSFLSQDRLLTSMEKEPD